MTHARERLGAQTSAGFRCEACGAAIGPDQVLWMMQVDHMRWPKVWEEHIVRKFCEPCEQMLDLRRFTVDGEEQVLEDSGCSVCGARLDCVGDRGHPEFTTVSAIRGVLLEDTTVHVVFCERLRDYCFDCGRGVDFTTVQAPRGAPGWGCRTAYEDPWEESERPTTGDVDHEDPPI